MCIVDILAPLVIKHPDYQGVLVFQVSLYPIRGIFGGGFNLAHKCCQIKCTPF